MILVVAGFRYFRRYLILTRVRQSSCDSLRSSQFADDKLRSRLHTLLTSTCPSEVIVEPTCSADLRTMITQSCGGAPVETVSSSECLPKSTAVDPAIRAQVRDCEDEAQRGAKRRADTTASSSCLNVVVVFTPTHF